MPNHIDNSKYKETGTDIAYKEPFSLTTAGIRKKLILFSALAFLNNYFPIDLSSSHVFGIKFSDTPAPTLAGLLGCVVIYYTASLLIYTVQEIKAWLAQANTMQFNYYREMLHNIFAHHQGIHISISGATEQLRLNNKIEGNCVNQDEIERLNVHQSSFINMVTNLTNTSAEYEAEIQKAKALLDESYSNYKAAMFTQSVKIGLLEIVVPFLLAAVALYFSHAGVLDIYHVIFH